MHDRARLHGRPQATSSPSATPRSSASGSTGRRPQALAATTSRTSPATRSNIRSSAISDLNVAKLYNMLPADAGDTRDGRTAANNATVRTVYIIGPDKKIRAMLLYPMNSGRNFDEVLRLLDSVQLTESTRVATPVNWKPGEDVHHPAVGQRRSRAGKISGRLGNREALPPPRRPAAGLIALIGRASASAVVRPTRPRADRARRPALRSTKRMRMPMSH